jgi:hypothetical protein
VSVTEFSAAEMVAVAALCTANVVTVNVAVVDPSATVTVAGTLVAPGVSVASDTEMPPLPAGAALLNVTVPIAFA